MDDIEWIDPPVPPAAEPPAAPALEDDVEWLLGPRANSNPGRAAVRPIEGFDAPDVGDSQADAWMLSETPNQTPVEAFGVPRQPALRNPERVFSPADALRGLVAGDRAAVETQLDPRNFDVAPRGYDELSIGERAGEQWRSGVESLRQGITAMPLPALVEELSRADAAERGEPDSPNSPIPWASIPPDRRAAVRAQMEEAFGRQMASIIASRSRQAGFARNPRAEAIVQAGNEGRWGDAWRIFLSDPAGLTQQFAIESLPASLAMMAPGVIGGATGLLNRVGTGVATYLSSYATEYGGMLLEGVTDALRAHGVNPDDANAVGAFFRANPEAMREAVAAAARGANGPAIFDAFSMGFARGVRPGAGALRNTGRVGANLGIELAGEPAGAALGQVFAEGEVSKPGELIAELLGAGPQVVGSTVVGTAQELREAQLEGRSPPATQQPGAGLAGIRAGQRIEPTLPMPPGVAPPQATPSPAAPLSADPGTPPPPGAAQPSAGPTSPAAGATPGAAAPSPQTFIDQLEAIAADPRPLDQQTAATPAPGAAAVPPAAPAGAAAGAPQPTPAAPPPANTGRAELEGLLADPRPIEQIRAGEVAQQQAAAQQRQDGIAAMQGALPPGWRVVDEDGAISVLDPNGDWIEQFEQPPSDLAGLAASVAAVHQQGVQSGLYSDAVREGDGTRGAPVQAQNPGDVDAAAAQAAPTPTPAQAEAGNYKKGHLRLHGLDVTIENERGSTRSGVGKDGRPWSVQMPAHYGYVKGTTGRDGDQVDVYLGPRAEDPSAPVFVVDQVDADTGRFDEHKVMIGFATQAEAIAAYDAAFNDGRGPERRGGVTPTNLRGFQGWLATGNLRSPMDPKAVSDGIDRRKRAKEQAAQAEQAAQQAAAEADEDPAGSVEIVEGVAEANGLNLTQSEIRQAAALVDQGMSPKAAILQVTEAAALEAAGEAEAGAEPSELVQALNLLAELQAELDAQGQVQDARLAEKVRQVRERVRRLQAEAAAAEAPPAQAPSGNPEKEAEAEQSAPADAATALFERIKAKTVVFASGLSRVTDADAGTSAFMRFDTRGVGVEIGEVSANGMETLADAAAEGTRIFVDSGAFNLFRRNLKREGDAEAMDFGAVLGRYDQLLDMIDARTDDPGQRAAALMVMPDVVGDQAASLELVERYADWINSAQAAPSQVMPIVPIQKGDLTLAEAYREAVDTLGTDLFIVGIPSNAKAVSDAELRAFLEEIRPKRIHFLGAARDSRVDPKLRIIAEVGYEPTHVSADGNFLRGRLYGQVDTGDGKRRDAVIKGLRDNGGAEGAEYDRQAAELAALYDLNLSSEEKAAAAELIRAGLSAYDAVKQVVERAAIEAEQDAASKADEGSPWREVAFLPRDQQAQPDMLGGPTRSADEIETAAIDPRVRLDGTYPESAEDEDGNPLEPAYVGVPHWAPYGDFTPADAMAEFRDLPAEEQADVIGEIRGLMPRMRGMAAIRYRLLLTEMEKEAKNGDTRGTSEDGEADAGAGGAPAEADGEGADGTPPPGDEPRTGGADSGQPGTELSRLAVAFRDAFAGDRTFASIAAVRQFAARLLGRAIEPGTPAAKMVDEAAEAGIVMAARAIVARGRDPLTTYRALVDLYARQPRLAVRTADSIERQAYSTPAPLAYLASQLAGVTRNSVVLEPTAGTGMLLIGADPKKAIVNEIDGTRAQILALQGFDPTAADAAGGPDQGSFAQERADAVLANPPFGAVREADGSTRVFDLSNYLRGYDTRDIDHVISLRALEGMKDGGRAVLILGGVAKTAASAEARSKAYQGRSKREFFHVLYQNYRVTDHFTVSGDLYAKQGAAWPVDVIVIEGRGKSPRKVPASDVPRVYDTWDALEEVLSDGRRDGMAAAGTPAGVGAGPGSGAVGNPVLAGGSGQADDGAGLAGLPGGPRPVDGGAGGRPGGSVSPAGSGVRGPRPGTGAEAGSPAAAPGGAADGRPDGGVAGEPPGADGPGGLADDGQGRPGGRGGDRGDDAGGVAGSGVRPGSGSDVADAFDGAFEELFGEAPPAPAAAAPMQDSAGAMPDSASAMQGRPPAAPTAGQAAASAVKNAASGADDAMAALTQLFGGGKQLNSGLGWDEKTWEAAKPLFLRAIQKFRAAASDARQAMMAMMKELRDAYGWTKDMVLAARAYMERFIADVTAGRIRLDDVADDAAPPDAPARDDAAPAAEQPRDEPTEHQVPYEPVAGNRAVGTLTPRNIQSATREALLRAEQRAGKPLLNFVADKMGMTAAQAERAFSAEQVDALALAIQRVDAGEAFVIGDQTGVGKGRFVAGMLRYALNSGLVPVFVTEKANLYRDMVRDLTDIGMADVIPQILPTNANLRLPLAEDAASDEADEDDETVADSGFAGPMIRTPPAKQHVAAITAMTAEDLIREKKIVFSSYSQLQGSHPSLRARVAWFERIMPASMLVLDEAHNATGGVEDPNASRKQKPDPNKAPHRGINFQNFVAKAKGAVFSSATAAKRPQNMLLYAMRTALRRAVGKIEDVPKLIARGGVPVQQIITRMMAEGGYYLRRERSFAGVTYETQEVAVQHAEFDRLAESLRLILEINEAVIRPAIDVISHDIIDESGVVQQSDQGTASVESTEFAALMHNIIKQGLLGAKAAAVAAEAINRLRAGERPVIALSSTMGSFIQAYVETGNVRPGERVDLPFNALLQRYLRRLLLVTIKPPGARSPKDYIRKQLTPEQLGPDAERAYRQLDAYLGGLDFAGMALSPIDRIRADLIAAGYKVGEITGRQHAVDYDANGNMTYRVRGNSERSLAARLSTIQRFNDGREVRDGLDVVILNQAGATGLSLHASPAVGKDTRKRVMMIAQADDDVAVFMQMLGRVHRTGQIIAPSYVHLAADVPAEMRPAAALAKRMASLNANTTANRKSAVSSDEGIDFLNEYGDEAAAIAFDELDPAWQMVMGIIDARDEDGKPREDIARRATGRANLLPVEIQREFIGRLVEAYQGIIEAANEAGTNKLEAKSLPLDAVALDSEAFVQKKGATEFEAEARITRYDVARVRKMPTPGQIVKRVMDAATGEDWDVSRDMSVSEATRQLNEILPLGHYDDRRDAWLADIDSAHRRRVAFIEDSTSDPDKARAAKAKEDGRRDQARFGVEELRPGRLLSIILRPDEFQTAMVIGLRPPKNPEQAATPSAWEVTLLTADGVTVRQPLSGLLYEERDGARAQRAIEAERTSLMVLKLASIQDPTAFFAAMDEAAKASREERFIITGNLVAALDKVKGSGQIVFFSERGKGNVQGILMPADWSLKKFKEKALPSFLSAEAADYLTDPATPLSAAQIRTSKGDATISRADDGTFVLSVPASKKEGGRWFQDKALQAAIGGAANFVSRGDRLRARVSPAQLRAVLREVGRIATGLRQDLVSDATEAKAWLARRRGETPDGGDGVGLYANPFDPALFNRLIMQPLRAALGGSTALNSLATRVGDFHRDIVSRLFRDPPLPANTTIEERPELRDVSALSRWLKTPQRLFAKFPPLARLVEHGIRAEQRMQVWRKAYTDRYEGIRKTLRAAKGDWEKVASALYEADRLAVDLGDATVAAEFWEEQGLTEAEATAARDVHRLLMRLGRLVDQHRRAMLPTIKARKVQIWKRMEKVLNSARVDSDEYAQKYRRRAYLAGRIRNGLGDIDAQTVERDRLSAELRSLRTSDPEIRAEYERLAEEYDALEARLAQTSIRSRLKGYFPHKFYGSWRLFVIEKGADGADVRREITSDQGFYDSRGQAIAAATIYAEQNPGARLEIRPKKVEFPPELTGAVLTDAGYRRLQAGIEESAGMSTDEVRDALKGVARRRSRRRVLSAAMKRDGAAGYAGATEGTEAEMADKVLRTHIGQIVRYVVMDRLKADYVATTERLGLSPGRAKSIEVEGRAQLFQAIEAWWRDVNGAKQGFEQMMDSALQRMGVPASTLAAAAVGAGGGMFVTPWIAPVLSGYLGYRMFKAMTKGGEFPTRSFIGGVVGDMAHLKLGMFVNVGSALVNLSQTAVNTWPLLGSRWTAEGIRRAGPALWSQAVNAANPGRMSEDAHLLRRLDVSTDHRFTEDNEIVRPVIGTMRRASMFMFEQAERMNRATVALGAYYKAEAEGMTPAQALEEARQALTRTQFHQGLANKPEILRQQWARIPTQFQNFLFQQIAFMFSLRGTGQILRFLTALFVVAGALGLAGWQILDWMLEKVMGQPPSVSLREWAIDTAAGSAWQGTAAQVLLRGFPALFGVDVSARVGMGAGFGPKGPSDLLGPTFGTLGQLRELARRDAPVIDQLAAITPVARQAQEAAGLVSGDDQRTSAMRRGYVEDRPTATERAIALSGLRPIGRSMEADVREGPREDSEDRKKGLDRYLARMVRAAREGRDDDIGQIWADARAAGIQISALTIRRALRDANLTRAERDIRRAPRDQRPDLQRRHDAVREYRGAAGAP